MMITGRIQCHIFRNDTCLGKTRLETQVKYIHVRTGSMQFNNRFLQIFWCRARIFTLIPFVFFLLITTYFVYNGSPRKASLSHNKCHWLLKPYFHIKWHSVVLYEVFMTGLINWHVYSIYIYITYSNFSHSVYRTRFMPFIERKFLYSISTWRL